MYRKENREMDTEPSYRFLTGSLNVKYLKPTPIDCTLQIRGRIKEIDGKKVTIDVDLIANGIVTVKGEVVAIQVPDKYIEDIIKSANQK